jgi:hypothetical protein
VDFIALKTINAIEPTNATNNANMLRQPAGTNHFQFRIHQLGRGVRGTAGFCSMEPFYFSSGDFCNHSSKGYERRVSPIACMFRTLNTSSMAINHRRLVL